MLSFIVGPSGVGKSTIWRGLLKFPNVKPFKTHTDRNIRQVEIEEKSRGEELQYHFETVEDFKQMIKDGKFFEYVEFAGGDYGTVLSDLLEALNDPNNVWVGIVEINGYKLIKQNFPCVTGMFLLPKDFDQLESRLRERNSETEIEIQKRLSRAKIELASADIFDYKIINDDLDSTLNEAYKIIENLIKK